MFEDEKLSGKARKTIQNPHNEILVSIISYWEIALQYGLGKLSLSGITPEELVIKEKEIDIDTLAIKENEAMSFYRLPKLIHKDPFDRLIIWQAINNNIPLITKDKPMTDYLPLGLKILW